MFKKINMDDTVKSGSQGYIYVTTTPDHPFGEKRKDRKKRYIYLHRALMEKHLGRYLEPDEQVDHKDKDKTHNVLSNLILIRKGDHQRDHTHRGNHFWKKSPFIRKGHPHKGYKKKQASSSSIINVISIYLKNSCVMKYN